MSTPMFEAFLLRPPFELDFPSNGGVVVSFPAGQPRSEHGPVCTELSQGDFSISFPTGSSVTIPSGNNVDVILNDEPFLLPASESGRLVVNFPSPGTISIPSGQTNESNPDTVRAMRLTIKCIDARIASASMDPLP